MVENVKIIRKITYRNPNRKYSKFRVLSYVHVAIRIFYVFLNVTR